MVIKTSRKIFIICEKDAITKRITFEKFYYSNKSLEDAPTSGRPIINNKELRSAVLNENYSKLKLQEFIQIFHEYFSRYLIFIIMNIINLFYYKKVVRTLRLLDIL